MAAPMEGSNADDSKTKPSNVHIPSIFDVRITRSPGSSGGIGSGDEKEIGGRPIPQLAEARTSFATPPRRAYQAKMGDVAVDMINEREERRKMHRNAQLQRIAAGIPGYNQACFDRRPQNRLRNVLTRMEDNTTGPLNLLYRSVKENRKVKVWTRSCKSVRGICTGYVVAYDKHWNLAMYDVDEVYKNPAVKRKAWSERRKQKKKRLRQRTPQDGKTEEVTKKVDEAQDDDGDGEQKLMVETSTDVKPEATLPEVADIKHFTVKDTETATAAAAATATATTTESDENKTTPIKEEEEDDTIGEGQSLKAADDDDDDDEEDLESLALKLNKLKEELGEISIKEVPSVETKPEPVQTSSSDVDTKLDINREPGRELESELPHFGDFSGAKPEQSEAVLDEKICQSETKTLLKEELKHEGQHSLSTAVGRRPVGDGKQTCSSSLETGDGDGDDTVESDDGDAVENEGVLKRHVNQLFIRGDNVVMVSLVPLRLT